MPLKSGKARSSENLVKIHRELPPPIDNAQNVGGFCGGNFEKNRKKTAPGGRGSENGGERSILATMGTVSEKSFQFAG
jgi:hypothetical protein